MISGDKGSKARIGAESALTSNDGPGPRRRQQDLFDWRSMRTKSFTAHDGVPGMGPSADLDLEIYNTVAGYVCLLQKLLISSTVAYPCHSLTSEIMRYPPDGVYDKPTV